jgi:hypothetical protein
MSWQGHSFWRQHSRSYHGAGLSEKRLGKQFWEIETPSDDEDRVGSLRNTPLSRFPKSCFWLKLRYTVLAASFSTSLLTRADPITPLNDISSPSGSASSNRSVQFLLRIRTMNTDDHGAPCQHMEGEYGEASTPIRIVRRQTATHSRRSPSRSR